ncbi:MAG TPA: riboflavin synthase [Terriglobales bacterium]|nr:riboflavin synthase [Terriglobales bacterium]
MFTGIIGHLGTIRALSAGPAGGSVTIHAPTLGGELKVANSIAVNGCCLTIVSAEGNDFSADLSGETLTKTSFRELKPGTRVNLEQPLTAGKEFGGHFVLGHVDGVGRVTHLTPEGENWWYGVEIASEIAPYIVPKGSLTIDGISLTVARWHNSITEIAVIPFTYEHTNIRDRKPGDPVNLEGDILGKYVERHLSARQGGRAESSLSIEELIQQGFGPGSRAKGGS